MKESTKTLAFASFGGAMCALAILAYFMTQPKATEGFEGMGQPFFENFTDSTAAKSLEVYAVDDETAKPKRFVVKEVDGIWRIPSHHNYPAEAADRLATTASSLIGIEREALKGRHKTDHERFGVLDPNDPDVSDPGATGKRITLKDDADDVLVDLIIGNRVEEDPNPEQMVVGQNVTTNRYYVRHPEENQTYVVSLDLDLSTRFSDWIRPDLLQVDNQELEYMKIDNYELQPAGPMQLVKKQGDQMTLHREGGFGEWKMDGLDDSKETLESAKINAAISTIDELKIVGVRPKMDYQGQPLLTADLQINEIPELMQDPNRFNSMIQQLQMQLSDYGFNLLPTNVENQLQLVSNFGEIAVGTGAGVMYTMQFGKALEGDEDEIEIGNSSEATSEEQAQEPKAEVNAPNGEGDSADSEEIKNRYLMIRVSFDESLLGDKPTKPIEPVAPSKPEGYEPAQEPEKATDEKTDEDAAPAPSGETEENADQDAEREEPNAERDPKFVEYEKQLAEFEQQKTKYELDLTKYNDDTKAHDDKVAAGKKRVAALNQRFASWFYVISAENLKALQMNRADLVAAKSAGGEAASPNGLPERPNLNFDTGDSELNASSEAGTNQ